MSEAIIVGAGPGGCVAAVALARRGWGVTLIEQHQFPREKVCGECLSALGIEVLGRLGLVDEIRACRPVVLKRTVLHGQHRDSVSIALPREMWGLSRWALDDALLTAARGHGVRVLQPARCEGIRSGKRPSVTVRELLGNTTITLVADWVVLADGKAGLLPRRPPATGDLGIKAHIREVDGPRDAIELFGLPGNYGGMAPIEGERWNAAFSVPSNRLKMFGGDVERLMGQMMRENPVLACRLRGASKVGEWHVSPLPRFGVSTDWPAGIVPIGNAAAALEPIGGEGMGLAMRSAEMAADALKKA